MKDLIKKIELEQKEALESRNFHLRGGDKYDLATYFNGKRDAFRIAKRLIKN